MKEPKVVKREDLPSDYQEMMKTESHHDHEIVFRNGVLRWKEDPFVNRLIDAINLNLIVKGFYQNGKNKNSEVWRELYRKMGYSLSGYWEIFYWGLNNEDCEDYRPPQN